MILLLILLFPVCEIYLMVEISHLFSFFDVVLYFISMGFLGSFLLRILGSGGIQEIQAQMASGQAPQKLVLHRGLMMLGALLILIPGFLSDALGLLCLLPGTRHLILWLGERKLKSSLQKGNFRFYSAGNAFGGFRGGFSGADPFDASPRQERDAQVIDIQALESQSRIVKDPQE